MENLNCYLLLALFFIFLFILRKYSSYRHQNLPPSPPCFPIIGHFHLIKTALHQALASISSEYGPIVLLQLGWRSFLVVSSPSLVEECFTKNDIVFANRPRTMFGDHLTYNYNVFVWSSYGVFWRNLRRLSVVELFSSQSLQNSAPIREQGIRAILRVLASFKNESWSRVNLNYLASAFTFNNVMRILAGRWCVNEEDLGTERGKEIVKRMRGTFFHSLSISVCDYFPVLRWIGYKGLEKNLMSVQRKRDEFIKSLIYEVQEKDGSFSVKAKKNTLIETLLSLQESEPEFYTEEVVRSTVLVMIIAGTETSAATIESAMSLLLSHQEKLHKLKQEIDNNVGHNRLIQDADLPKLPYLRCVAKEALRLHPPVPLVLPHYSSEDCTVDRYKVPKGTTLLVNAWGMHRDPKVWEEPEKFSPERFLNVEFEKDDYRFVPFGIGRRACPGAGMGLRTITLAVGAFVQCFDWEKVVEDGESVQRTRGLEAVCVPRVEAANILSQL